jgi:hypothetical protein
MTAKPSQPTTTINAADFPALRSFLRGYFHQDMKEEYGSPAEAVREFCDDASPEERGAVSKEWSRFLERTGKQPLGQINHHLTGTLGSSYSLTAEDIAVITSILSPPAKSK